MKSHLVESQRFVDEGPVREAVDRTPQIAIGKLGSIPLIDGQDLGGVEEPGDVLEPAKVVRDRPAIKSH